VPGHVHGHASGSHLPSAVAGVRVPPSTRERPSVALVPVVHADRPGGYDVRAFHVDYHVGPLHYRVFEAGALHVCFVPPDPNEHCA